MPSKLEAEMMKVTKQRQAAGEPRSKYLLRLLEGGQALTKPQWNTLSAEAQSWYNDGVKAYMAHNSETDIKDFPDLPPPPAERATLRTRPVETEPEPETEDETVDESQPEEGELEEEQAENGELVEAEGEAIDEEFEEDLPPLEEPEEEVVEEAAAPPAKKPPAKKQPPPKAAAPKPQPKPAGKPAPKPASGKPPKATEAATVSRPPKPAPPGASTMIKRMLLKNLNVTNAELMEKLKAEGIMVTPISVSTIRSDFRHSLRVLQEAGIAMEVGKL